MLVRSVFVSDLHLGCKYANANALLAFLKQHQPEYLYLVGDIIDGWRLQRGWYWDDSYSFLVRRILGMLKSGTIVRYTPGNHDEFLRHFIDSLGSVQIADEFIHHTADGQRVLVMHGDQFDSVVKHARWLSLVGDVGYNALLALNRWFNLVRRRCGFGYWSLSAAIKRQVKQATNFISDFDWRLIKFVEVHIGDIRYQSIQFRGFFLFLITKRIASICLLLPKSIHLLQNLIRGFHVIQQRKTGPDDLTRVRAKTAVLGLKSQEPITKHDEPVFAVDLSQITYGCCSF